MDQERIKLWDLPTRIVHWLLAALTVAAVVTGKIGGSAIDWHGRIGLAILGLITFRFIWGVVGSSHARFASFFPTARSVVAYLRGQWYGVGHNPLGAISVFSLLTLIALQIGTGLFSNDDIAFRGPLGNLIGKGLSEQLIGIHKISVNVLIALIVLHLGAILFYTQIKKDDLVRPMITGWKDIPLGAGKSATGGGVLAFCIALLISMAAIYGGSGEWFSTPPPAPPAATPAW